MRPIERKVLDKIGDNGLSFDQVEEIIDSTSRSELCKSFPDDSLFQTPRYFAKVITESLLRQKFVIREGSLFKKPKPREDQKPKSDS
jgi:hypothetical protein